LLLPHVGLAPFAPAPLLPHFPARGRVLSVLLPRFFFFFFFFIYFLFSFFFFSSPRRAKNSPRQRRRRQFGRPTSDPSDQIAFDRQRFVPLFRAREQEGGFK